MMANISVNIPKSTLDQLNKMSDQISNQIKQSMLTGTIPTHSTFHSPRMIDSDDLEQRDIQAIEKLIELYYKNAYPDFEPEIIHGMNKDYFLPALKVLDWDGENFYSPQRMARWDKLELVAKCEKKDLLPSWSMPSYKAIDHEIFPNEHDWESCQCGIYGSVNLEEIQDFYNQPITASPQYLSEDSFYNPYPFMKKLVIIEPSPNADIIIARKGWRAQSAFISEIIGETITLEETSRLLSIAWHRTIDIQELRYENR